MDSSKRRPRLVFVNRVFYPDDSATSQMLTDLVDFLDVRETKFDILIIASANGFGVKRIRNIWSSRFPTFLFRACPVFIKKAQSILGKSLNGIVFCLSTLFFITKDVKAGDVVVFKTDPPFCGYVCSILVARIGAKVVHWTQDLFPDVPAVLYGKRIPPSLVRVLKKVQIQSFLSASKVVCISEGMKQRVKDFGVPSQKLVVIENWFLPSNSLTVENTSREAGLSRDRLPSGIQGRLLIGYFGNFGRAHNFASIVQIIELCQPLPVAFLFSGGGINYDKLRSTALNYNWDHVLFFPYQPRDLLDDWLVVPDMHLISLDVRLDGLVVPSKYYAAEYSGKPILFVGDPAGDTARKIEQGDSNGLVAGPEEVDRVISWLQNFDALRPNLDIKAKQNGSIRHCNICWSAWLEQIEHLMEEDLSSKFSEVG